MEQLTDYFSDLLESHSWSTVKLDLNGSRPPNATCKRFFFLKLMLTVGLTIWVKAATTARRTPRAAVRLCCNSSQ